ncbi:MAG TPA: YitT family protein [Candidatus Dorea intestinavium]|nr:YitT family protein [Candidatus Dorea intestinavium]
MSKLKKLRQIDTAVPILYAILGSFIFAFGVNVLIMPLGLYNGGFMGIAQLIRYFMNTVFHIQLTSTIDITGIIYFLINVPLFLLGYKELGRNFTIKTLITVTVQSFFLSVIPIPSSPIVEDYLTACIIGGLIAGTGTGLVLRARTSGGGQDIIGLVLSKKKANISVGKINIMMNVMIYCICLFLFNIEIVVYSLIYTTVLSLAIDRVHIQNINVSVMIFTKKLGISRAIIEQMGRGVTNWDGEGAYTQKTSYILYVIINKYEKPQLRQIVKNIDPAAFIIYSEGCTIDGNFEKRL